MISSFNDIHKLEIKSLDDPTYKDLPVTLVGHFDGDERYCLVATIIDKNTQPWQSIKVQIGRFYSQTQVEAAFECASAVFANLAFFAIPLSQPGQIQVPSFPVMQATIAALTIDLREHIEQDRKYRRSELAAADGRSRIIILDAVNEPELLDCSVVDLGDLLSWELMEPRCDFRMVMDKLIQSLGIPPSVYEGLESMSYAQYTKIRNVINQAKEQESENHARPRE